MGKGGVTLFIGAVLLIAITLTLSVIIFQWSKSFLSPPTTLDGRSIEFSCPEVNFEAGLFNKNELEIINRGNLQIHGFNIKVFTLGSITPNEVLSSLAPGQSITINLHNEDLDLTNAKELNIIPILIGDNNEHFTCPDNFGFLIEI
jgi:hypothetical protein